MTVQGVRKFYEEFPANAELSIGDGDKEIQLSSTEETNKLFAFINENIIGKNLLFNGPFGKRKVIHCDYTASGRSLKYVEDYIQDVVLPHYGNTHTTTSITSLQTTMFRDEARNIIRKAVNASEKDAIIFTGSGSTSAVHKLIHALKFQAPPIVFVSPFEHHSNLLPWKEIDGKIIWTGVLQDGNVDLNHLEMNLIEYQNCGQPLIGCFSAASNITGVLVDTDAVAALLHKYNGLAFFDYASAGPYVDIDMNPSNASDSYLTHKDAVFLSPHKFVGGPGTPGILAAKKHLFVNPVPSGGGGGSVFYVTASTHRYLKEIEQREEGGTQDLIGSIRAGLVFQLKQNVRCENIIHRDEVLLRQCQEMWGSCPNLVVLSQNSQKKLPIFSFVIKHPTSGRLLHHNFVSVLLNDLFGIQSRGGCACAGPYAQDLLGMSEDVALKIEDLLLEDQRLDRHHLRRHREYSDKEIIRPGFTRINLPYFYDNEVISFILKAVYLVAEHGWKLLPEYLFNPETGEWKYRNFQRFKDRKWIGSLKYENGNVILPKIYREDYQYSLKDVLNKAEAILLGIKKAKNTGSDQTILFGEEGEKLRWFLLPCEAVEYLNGETPESCKKFSMPFFPRQTFVANKFYKNSHVINSYSQHYCTCSPLHMNMRYGTADKRSLQHSQDVSVRSESPSTINDIVCRCENSTDKNTEDIGMLAFDNCVDTYKDFHDNSRVSKEHGNQSLMDSYYAHNNSELFFESSSSAITNVGNSDRNSIDNNTQSEILLLKNTEDKKSEVLASCHLKMQSRASSDVMNGIKSDVKFHNPTKVIFSSTVEAIQDFKMIANGDRVLLCLSGGKDSLSMLHVIHQFQFYAKKKDISFQFGAVTVDPQSAGYDPSPLKEYLKLLNVPYFFEEQDIIGAASNLSECESICSYCSRMKRGRIYACARREGYNVVALGQHLDDISESFLMSTFHNGYLRSMKANYHVKEGDIRVIRPLIYVREKDLRNFAEKMKLPVIPENCPACFEAPKERHRMKQLLAQQEVLFPNLFKSLRTALYPLIAKSKTGLEKRIFPDDDEEYYS